MRFEQNHPDPMIFGGDAGDFDDLFDILSNSRRRFLTTLLEEQTEPMAMADAAEELTKWECDVSGDQVPKEQVQSRYVALHHVHVPKMVNYGILTHDEDSNTIALTNRGEAITARVARSLK